MTHAGKYIDNLTVTVRSLAASLHEVRMQRDKLAVENNKLRAENERLKLLARETAVQP